MSQFQRFLAKRLAISIGLTLIAVSVIFVVLRLLPGSPFEALVTSGNLNQQQINEIRALYGLDQPMWRQYIDYMVSILTFQFGYSILRSQPVWDVLEPRLVNTLILLVPALVTTAILSSALGMYAGWNRGSLLEKSSIITTTFLRSTPVFITAIFFIIVFAYNLELVPAFGMRSVTASPEGYVDTFLSIDFLHHYLLPFTVAVLYYSGDFLLLARNGIVEKRGSEFLKLHKAKGLTEMQQLARAGRNSMLPILTYFALRLGMIFQGLILLEVVFGWPGIGRELVLAIQQQDYPLVQAAVFIMALAVIIANLAADVLYAYFDPTVSTGGGSSA
ncbi:peptide/nickel transport system permease protein [Haloarcula vallismortis]|uniref:Binding-protein-dependent transport systems inner membrane component n=2 Tax=Haloarcula vallismortis TaxID=28442 RepID=M0JI22_HALVA|nr:ABC transporter permease [Haloarcula vallismortis]EMA08777.1 binding-protein-dependent transport systems inner membrane component [Haloarcula vallismortis ATCC 29715]SDX37152.1 peptide/nickel transport system permease protein [Haloarcula vallismortis]